MQKETIKLIALSNHISDERRDAIIFDENKMRKIQISPETKMTEKAFDELYKKRFGKSMKE